MSSRRAGGLPGAGLLLLLALALAGCSGRAAGPSQRSAAPDPHPAAGNFEPDGTKLASCHDQACYEQAFGDLAYYRGPRTALRVFDEKQKTDAAVEAGCHRIAHSIGSAALARYHGNVPRAFAEGSSSCWSGYYHGILERAFAGASGKPQFVRIARRVCEGSYVRRTTYLAYQCVHGLGHGLMLQSGYDLPFALSICDRLPTSWDQTSCTGGVFMENVNGAVKSGYGTRSPWVKNSDLVYPCDWVKDRYKLYCYLMVTSRILQANGYDWQATGRICARVERGWRATCFQSYGRDASGTTHQNPVRVLALCRLTGRFAKECLYGAARDISSNDASPTRAADLCVRAPAPARSRCYFGIGTIVGTLAATVPGRRSECVVVPRPFRHDCLAGAGVIAA